MTDEKWMSSSIYRKKRFSFFRSKGESAADVQTLRGTRGADFEGEGRIHRGVQGAGCLCFGGREADAKKDRYLFVKGPFCFVFSDEEAPAPKYALSLLHIKAEVKPSQHGRWPVILTANLGEVQYELSFPSEKSAQKFAKAVKVQASKAHTEEVKKKLGHDHMINLDGSLMYVRTVADKKLEDQPEKPVSADVLATALATSGGMGPPM